MRLGWMTCMGGLAAAAIVGCADPATIDEPPYPADAGPVGDAGDGKTDDPGGSEVDYHPWEKVEIPGTVCGNGSQYKFFVSRSEGAPGSDNLLVYFEPGGACWDFDSCAGRRGIRGAANVDGIPDDHMDLWRIAVPMLRRHPHASPVNDWNMVFVSYCTGDVHTGNNVVTYEDPTGAEPDLEFHHAGHDNNVAIAKWLGEQFEDVDKLLVTGCSAGGVGSLVNYHFLRQHIDAERGYLLSDSGPLFPDSENSAPLHEKIAESWNVDPVIDRELPDAVLDDYGALNAELAEMYPDDRLASTYYRLDYNYSLYSYERFQFDGPDAPEPGTDAYRARIYEMWWEDTQNLMAQYDRYDNLAYYIPFYRDFNSSHCLTPGTWTGTEIQEDGLDLQDYIERLLDDGQPLESHLEETPEGPYADLAP